MNIDISQIKAMLDLSPDWNSNPEKLDIIIENGVDLLLSRNPLLTEGDFNRPSPARTLLHNYCRYAFSNAEEMFKVNYAEELMLLRLDYEVKACESQE